MSVPQLDSAVSSNELVTVSKDAMYDISTDMAPVQWQGRTQSRWSVLPHHTFEQSKYSDVRQKQDKANKTTKKTKRTASKKKEKQEQKNNPQANPNP